MNTRFFHAFLVCAAILLTLQGCGAYVATSGKVVVRDDRATIKPGFSTRDRLQIEDYFHKQNMPAGHERLPASFAVRERLPASIQGRPLPRALEARLTVLPATYARLQVGRDVLLMERDSRVVLDLLRGLAAE